MVMYKCTFRLSSGSLLFFPSNDIWVMQSPIFVASEVCFLQSGQWQSNIYFKAPKPFLNPCLFAKGSTFFVLADGLQVQSLADYAIVWGRWWFEHFFLFLLQAIEIERDASLYSIKTVNSIPLFELVLRDSLLITKFCASFKQILELTLNAWLCTENIFHIFAGMGSQNINFPTLYGVSLEDNPHLALKNRYKGKRIIYF